MHSAAAFLAIAAAVTLTPGPSFALVLQTAAVHGRTAALANIAGNSIGVLTWGLLSAVGVSALLAANQIAYEVLRLTGAAYLIYLGVRALLNRRAGEPPAAGAAVTAAGSAKATGSAWAAARKGVVNSLANPKLAVFFVALFPQFVTRGGAVLPAATAMAGGIVAFDAIWFGTVAVLVDRFRRLLRPAIMRWLQRTTGAVLLGFGIRLAAESR